MSLRLAARGFNDERNLPFPIRQRDIADALGLTPVHVSRVLQEFRAEDIADLGRARLSIIDRNKLMELSGVAESDMDITKYGVDLRNFIV